MPTNSLKIIIVLLAALFTLNALEIEKFQQSYSLGCDTTVTATIYNVVNLCIGQTDVISGICRCISSNLMNGYYPNTNWETVAYQDSSNFYLNNYAIDDCAISFKSGGINYQVWKSK
jgi:hypothetical protein